MKVTILITTILLFGLSGSLNAAVDEKAYAHLDKDGDGIVTTKEFVQHRMQGFVRRDANRDRFLNEEEANNPYFYKTADGDGDGMVSFEEGVRFQSKEAIRIDKDGDGILTFEELNPK